MQTYHVKLESVPSTSYRAQRAADSVDLDTKKKSIHELQIKCDISKPYKIGLIIGNSGSGKTTLAKKMFNKDFGAGYDMSKAVIDLFPATNSYEDCANALNAIGLSQIPCWVKPLNTLSNGQRYRAEAALELSQSDFVVLDEWTSVVDRTVAKIMSHALQKFVRSQANKQVVIISCHYDIVQWLDPDWVIDCNTQTFTDRGLLRPEERKRTDQLSFGVREVDRASWKVFSKYHYLSENFPPGKNHPIGLFDGRKQIGFCTFSNYVPNRKNRKIIMHSNRVVVHPDYVGFGLGLKMVDLAADFLMKKYGYEIRAKFTSQPMLKARMKNPKWKCILQERNIGSGYSKRAAHLGRGGKGLRTNVCTYTFLFRP